MGAIATKAPGIDFSDGPNMVAAYFACVNANGGIDGHPLKLYEEFNQLQPAQIAADAKKLVDSDHVVAMVGSFDDIACTVNNALWKQLGIYEIDGGIAPECWTTPNSAPTNMGPRLSGDAIIQYAITQGHVNKVVFAQANPPGFAFIGAGAKAVAAADHVPLMEIPVTVPINDPSSVALSLVDDAGPNGAVVFDGTPPDALPLLQAAQKLGLENRVKQWDCLSPCDTDFVAKALGPKWNHKLFVQAEVRSPDSNNSADMRLYKAILAEYGKTVSGGVGSFSEIGYLDAEMFVHALKTMKPPYTKERINSAILHIKDYKTPLLCQPWSYGRLPLHIPNNSATTVTVQNGKMVQAQACTAIPGTDPLVAQYRKAAAAAGFPS